MPSASTLLAFAVASVVIIAIPGPSVLFTIGRALSSGRREALLTVVGNALGILTQICGLALGLGPAHRGERHRLHGAQGGRCRLPAVARGAGHPAPPGPGGRLPLRCPGVATPCCTPYGLDTSSGSPTRRPIVFFAALLPQFVDPAGPVWSQLVALGAIFAVLAILLDGSVALVASRARDWFASSPRRMERVGGAGGLMMVGLGTGLLFTGRTD